MLQIKCIRLQDLSNGSYAAHPKSNTIHLVALLDKHRALREVLAFANALAVGIAAYDQVHALVGIEHL